MWSADIWANVLKRLDDPKPLTAGLCLELRSACGVSIWKLREHIGNSALQFCYRQLDAYADERGISRDCFFFPTETEASSEVELRGLRNKRIILAYRLFEKAIDAERDARSAEALELQLSDIFRAVAEKLESGEPFTSGVCAQVDRFLYSAEAVRNVTVINSDAYIRLLNLNSQCGVKIRDYAESVLAIDPYDWFWPRGENRAERILMCRTLQAECLAEEINYASH